MSRSAGPGVWVAGLLGGVLGVGIQLQQVVLAPHWWRMAGLGLAVGLSAWVWRQRVHGMPAGWRASFCAFLAMVATAWAVTDWRAQVLLDQSLPAALQGRDLQLVGVVAGLPRDDEAGSSFEFRVDEATYDGAEVVVPPMVRLSWRSPGAFGDVSRAAGTATPPRVRPGERWQFTARLYRPHSLSNPAGFDAELWLWSQGIRATGHVRGTASARLLEDTWQYPVQQARDRMRERLRADIASPRASGVMVALLAGDQAAINDSDWAVFRVTGIAHLISVSGLHVTMFAWVAMIALRVLWRSAGRHAPGLLWAVPAPVAAAVGGVAMAAAYAAFSGWGVPSQRTVLMLATVVALRMTGRQWPWPVVWLAAMNSVIWLDPWALLQAGFWLSFVAVGVLFAVGDGPMGAAPGRIAPRLLQALRDMLRTQTVVTVSLAPMTLLLFGQFSLVGLLANLLAIPWVTLLVTPLTMLGAVVPSLWWVASVAVDALLWGLEWFAQWPLAAVERPALPFALALLAILGGVVLVLPWPSVWRMWGALLLWPALAYQPPRPVYGQFELLAADIGQGTAVVVRTSQHTLLFDTGPPMGRASDAAQRVLLPLFRASGERPDAIMISHGDSDHAAGAATLEAAFPGVHWWSSSTTLPIQSRVEPCIAGQRWEWDDVAFEVLHPRPGDEHLGLSDNAMSCVLRVGDEVSALLTGDITTAEETRLALDQPELRTTVLMAAHHGSKTSSGPVWLNTVQPRWVIVQAGHRNRYGHPSPEVVRRFDDRQIPWVNTADCGAAHWQSQAPQTLTCHREKVRRYWHERPEN